MPGPKDRTIDTKQSLLRPQRITPKNNPDFCLQYPAECLFVGKIFSIFAVLTAFARSDIFESVFALSLTENVAVFKVAGQRTALISWLDHGNRCVLHLYPIVCSSVGYC
ncbi:MAG: hypothetical protein K2I13_01255, partial [Alistipes sp.]|nr:hypothetical protein [Alistipes sp.]